MTKRIVLIALFLFVNVFISRASVTLSGLSVNPEYLVAGRLNVANPSVPTNFKFQVMVSRPLAAGTSYQDGTCEVTLVYMASPNSSGSNSVAVSAPIQISNSNYSGGYATLGNLPATLPANIKSGAVMIKLTYFDTNQNKTLTIYIPQQVVNIQYTPSIPNYNNWITDYDDHIKYNSDWSSLIKWDAGLVNTSTVTFEVYQYGVRIAVIASNTPNDGEERIDWTPYAVMVASWYYDVQLKIISDANPSINGITPKFKMQID